jgi:NADH-quinone oxidoreductase subunit M
MQLHFPWLELTVFIPLLGAAWTSRLKHPETAHKYCLTFTALTFGCALGAWGDFGTLHNFEAHDLWDFVTPVFGPDVLVIDELSAPLLPLAAMLYLLTMITTMRTKLRRVSFPWTLLSETVLLATLSCKHRGLLVALLIAGTLPPFMELRKRRRSSRVFGLHMGVFCVLLLVGWGIVETQALPLGWGIGCLIAAVLIRNGIVPFHCWMTDLFEKATFGTALLFATPMVGAYAAVRLVLPMAPAVALGSMALISLLTAVYAAGMALVQREARRFFCFLFLSHASLVLVGLETATPVSLTGALSVWLSVGLALTGFGLTIRSIEARTGPLWLDRFYGLAEHTPYLAALFLLTGLASVGFPGTFGFVGMELLIDGTVQAYPFIGTAVVLAGALNGIAVLRGYFLLFTGTRHVSSVSLRSLLSERLAVLGLTLLILGGGLFPQPGIRSRYHAATELIREKQILSLGPPKREYDHASRAGASGEGFAIQQPKSPPASN